MPGVFVCVRINTLLNVITMDQAICTNIYYLIDRQTETHSSNTHARFAPFKHKSAMNTCILLNNLNFF